jgi:hypothetical protein
MKSGERNAERNTSRGKKRLEPLSGAEILNEYGALAVEKSRAASKVFSPDWDVPNIQLSLNRWLSGMPYRDAVELCLICTAVDPHAPGFVTYRVTKSSDSGAWLIEMYTAGRFTHWVAPFKYQRELVEWKRRLVDGVETT